jgi:hypothetical protein
VPRTLRDTPYPPKWLYPPPRVRQRGIFRTLMNLDILRFGSLGKGEVVCSIHTGSTIGLALEQAAAAGIP